MLASILPACFTPGVAAQTESTHTLPSASGKTPLQSPNTGLPVNFARRTGDLDSMVKAQNIRALVLYSHSGFFYVDGQPEGIFYEALQDFEQFVNQKLHTAATRTGHVYSRSPRPT